MDDLKPWWTSKAIWTGLIGSAWGLYYLGSETLRPVLSWTHWVVGLAIVPLMWWHVIPKGLRCLRSQVHRKSI